MAAKRTIRYRGQTIRLWDRSYSINGNNVIYVGPGLEPDLPAIKAAIDADIATGDLLKSERYSEPTYRDPTWFDRAFRRFELAIGAGGDLHRQVFYAWRDYPDAMKFTIATFFALGSLFATLAMIVGAWLIARS